MNIVKEGRTNQARRVDLKDSQKKTTVPSAPSKNAGIPDRGASGAITYLMIVGQR